MGQGERSWLGVERGFGQLTIRELENLEHVLSLSRSRPAVKIVSDEPSPGKPGTWVSLIKVPSLERLGNKCQVERDRRSKSEKWMFHICLSF